MRYRRKKVHVIAHLLMSSCLVLPIRAEFKTGSNY